MRILSWLGAALAIALLAGLLVGGVFISQSFDRENADSLTYKTDDSAPDVEELLSLSVRKHLYLQDWQERERIEEYTMAHFPIDLEAPRSIQDQQWRENDKEWNRLYDEFTGGVCAEYQITTWQYFQILDEGMEELWQAELYP